MPAERPGTRESVVRTDKSVARGAEAPGAHGLLRHGEPAVELGIAGIGFKSAQIAPMVPNVANADIATQIAVGEVYTIDCWGDHTMSDEFMPAGAVPGDRLFIRASDDALVLGATALTGGVLNAGFSKFGVLLSHDTTLLRIEVNLTQRSSF